MYPPPLMTHCLRHTCILLLIRHTASGTLPQVANRLVAHRSVYIHTHRPSLPPSLPPSLFSPLPLSPPPSLSRPLSSLALALALSQVPMVSVLKNIGPILITILESWTDGKQISSGIWLSMAMLILGLSPPVPLPLPRSPFLPLPLPLPPSFSQTHLVRRQALYGNFGLSLYPSRSLPPSLPPSPPKP
jgi:hypothetical protein